MYSGRIVFAQLMDVLPIDGKRLHSSTLWRWCRRGVKGVKLEYRRFGRRICTTTAALDRFARRLAAADEQVDPVAAPPRPNRPRTDQQRQKDIWRFRIFWQVDSGNSVRFMRPRQGSAVKSLQVAGSVRRPVHDDQAAPLQDAIDDGFGQVAVVQSSAPFGERGLVGREDHRPPLGVAGVDDVERNVGGIGPVAQIADLVDDEQVRLDISSESLSEVILAPRI